MTIIKNNISFQQVDNIHHKENNRKPSKNTSINEWKLLLDSSKNFKYTLIGGDFNSHDPTWGSDKICFSGDNLIEALIDYDLSIINNGKHTYYYCKNDQTNNSTQNTPKSSAIDLTLTSTNLLNSTTWNILSDRMESDHFPIILNLQLKYEKVPLNMTQIKSNT